MMDTGASVLAKLRNKSKASGKPLQLHLQLFCQEEFLRRISLSPYADNLILKGGLFIYALTNFESRATVDVDFLLWQLPGSTEQIKEIIENILEVDTGNDYITFTSQGFEEISPQRKYRGVSFQLIGHIKNTRTPFDVDIGIGDVIVPKAEKRRLPVQLDDFQEPVITTYSIESTIAEKFDAILQRLQLTSRMKDFYDIYYLSQSFDFEGIRLQQAIFETLQNRSTPYEAESFEKIIALASDQEMQVQWRRFLHRLNVPELSFEEVLHGMDAFLRPVWNAIISENELLLEWRAATLNMPAEMNTGAACVEQPSRVR